MDVFKTLILDTPDSLENASGVLPVVNGGTGADNASDARDNLGLGTIATQDADAVAITGGSATGLTSLGVVDDATLGSSNSDTVTFNSRIASEFTPATDNTYDLGRTGHEWRNLYVDGTANIDSLVADTADVNGAVNAASVATTDGFDSSKYGSNLAANVPQGFPISDGSTTDRAERAQYGAIGDVAGLPATFVSEFLVPTSNPAATARVYWVGSTTSAGSLVASAQSMAVSTSGELVIIESGTGGGGDYRRLAYSTFRADYSGQTVRVSIAFSEGDSTTNPTIFINGEDKTSSFTLNTNGTPPKWMDASLDTTWFLSGYNWPAGRAPYSRVIVGALSDTEAADYTSGTALEQAAPWTKDAGSAVDPSVAIFADRGGANGYETFSGATATGVTLGHTTGNISQAGKYAYNIAPRRKVRVSFTLALTSGVLPTRVGWSSSVASSTINIGTDHGGSVAVGANEFVEELATSDTTIGWSFVHAPGDATSEFVVSDFKVEVLGSLDKPIYQQGSTLTADALGRFARTLVGMEAVTANDPRGWDIDSNGDLATGSATKITDTTASSSTTTGALVVSGGAGVAGTLNAASVATTDGFDSSKYGNKIAARGPRKGVVSDGTSALGTTQDNASLALGTGDFSFSGWLQVADWTPAAAVQFATNYNAATYEGFVLILNTDGSLRIAIGDGASGTTSYNITETNTVSANNWAYVAGTFDRNGNATFYVNGTALGSVDISADSAQTLTSSAAWKILETAGGTSYAGKVGEWAFVDGLLTSDQVATIHANGTARGMGLTMYQHLVPSDTLGYGIYEDISGNNNHAALGGIPGTNGIDTVLPVELPQETVKVPALRGDGSALSGLYSTLNDQNPDAGDFTLIWRGVFPQDGTSSSRLLAGLADSSTDPYGASKAPESFEWSYNTTLGIFARFYNTGSASNYRALSSLELYTVLVDLGAKGVPCALAVSRSTGGTMQMWLLINGQTVEVTNLFVESTSGTPPAWSDAIAGEYLHAILRTSTISSSQDLHDLRLYNAAPDSLAEAADAMSPTPQLPKFHPVGDATNQLTGIGASLGTDSADKTAFNSDYASYFVATGTNAVVSSNQLTLTANNTFGLAGAAGISSAENEGLQVRISFYVDSIGSGGWNLWESGSGSVKHPVAVGLNQIIITQDSTNPLRLYATTTGSEITIDASVTPFKIEVVGQTVGLDLSDGGGFQPKNPRFKNGSSHWEMSTSGVSWTVPSNAGKQIAITRTYAHDGISSTASTTLHGTLPPKHRISAIILNQTTDFDASTTLNVGNGSGAGVDRYAAAMDLSYVGFNDAVSSRLRPESLTATSPIYLQKNQATTQGEVTVTIILESVF